MGLEDPRRQDLEGVLKAAQRAAELTRQLLTLGRRQAGRAQLLNLSTIIVDLEKMLRRLLSADVELDTLLEPGLPSLNIDPAHLEQIIINLVLNARDAIQAGGRIVLQSSQADISTQESDRWEIRPGPYVCLTVSDTGMGMSEQVLSHIFEPFFTTKESGKGSGLGLASVYGIIKQHQGHISVESQPGAGTTFRVFLPCSMDPNSSSSPPMRTDDMPEGKERILVVEDESIVRRTVTRLLRKGGYTVFEAASPEEAMAAWANFPAPPDLLLTDVVMPGMNGRELAQWALARHPGLAVVYMSGYSADVISRNGILEPDTHFIEKSFSQESMLKKVRAVLDATRARPPVPLPDD
jgi:CheY-like chemotaxis protein